MLFAGREAYLEGLHAILLYGGILALVVRRAVRVADPPERVRAAAAGGARRSRRPRRGLGEQRAGAAGAHRLGVAVALDQAEQRGAQGRGVALADLGLQRGAHARAPSPARGARRR